MTVTIQSSFPVREHQITSYYSYPVYSNEIERTMSRQLEFLKQYENFSLVMTIEK